MCSCFLFFSKCFYTSQKKEFATHGTEAQKNTKIKNHFNGFLTVSLWLLWQYAFLSAKLMEINLQSENKKNPFRPQAKRILQN
jgi:hypothetical protein